MGKKFEKAKERISHLKNKEQRISQIYNKTVSERVELQREWYGVADGDVVTVSSLEKVILASKRWIK